MHTDNLMTNTKVSETFEIPGYVVDADLIRRIGSIARQAVVGEENDNLQCLIGVSTKDEEMQRFKDVDGAIEHLESESILIESITLQYTAPVSAGISVSFLPRGIIELSAYSEALDFQFNLDRLSREIKTCSQDYSWPIRAFILGSIPKVILTMVLLFASMFLAYNIWYYSTAQRIGVNVDPSILPVGNEYYQEVERAVKSNDLTLKLNILLVAQLKGFINVNDVLADYQKRISVTTVISIISAMLLIITIAISRLYPLSFFAFGTQKKTLQKLQRSRDIWNIAIVIGFVVNIVAGIVLALFTTR